MTIDIITIRGAGELGNSPNNMLANVVRRLDKQRFRYVADLDYPASVGPVNPERNPFGPSLSRSLNVGKRNLADAIRHSPNRVGILGYSLGAYVVSDFLEDMAAGAEYTRGCELLFVGLVANPRRAPGGNLPGYGIAGAHFAWPSIRAFDVAHAGDGIPCCPDKSPLRRVADFLIGGQRPPQVAPSWRDWLRDPIGTHAQYDAAGRYIAGYLSGEHTTWYIAGGHLDRLADAINAGVW